MKKIALICILLAGMLQAANAQQTETKQDKKKKEKQDAPCNKVYIGFSVGLNNPAGLIGLDVDIPVSKNISVGAGFGPGSWGSKIYFDARYYLKPCHRGFAFGAGISHNGGTKDFKTNLETINGKKEDVVLDLNPQTNMFVSAYRFWDLGKRKNRVYLELGYSMPFATYSYKQKEGAPLSENGENVVKLISPGGLMFGVGFSFGVAH